jgi:hypothetical protein
MTSPSSPSASTSRPPPPSAFYQILATPYGGRGAFAKTRIPKNTTILQCQGPYASVIVRKFRKEVCAWCFAWCFESSEGRKGSWSIRLEGSEGQAGNGGNGAAWTPWFCREGCRDAWVEEYSWNGDRAGLDSLVRLMIKLEKTLVTYRNAKSRSKSRAGSPATSPPPHAFAFLDNWTPSDVSESSIDSAWKLAESLTDNLKKPAKILEMMETWNIASAEDPTELLTEFEADCARFVLDGILRRALQECTPSNSINSSDVLLSTTDAVALCDNAGCHLTNVQPTGLWPDLLHLQNNELQHIQSKPYMLGVFVRVYLFLKYIVLSAKPSKGKQRAPQDSASNDDTLPPETMLLETLETLLETSDSVRAILARDHGNVFGIWEKGLPCADDDENGEDQKEGSGDDGEMFGWGVYVFGSYFNHGTLFPLKPLHSGLL